MCGPFKRLPLFQTHHTRWLFRSFFRSQFIRKIKIIPEVKNQEGRRRVETFLLWFENNLAKVKCLQNFAIACYCHSRVYKRYSSFEWRTGKKVTVWMAFDVLILGFDISTVVVYSCARLFRYFDSPTYQTNRFGSISDEFAGCLIRSYKSYKSNTFN